MNTFINNRQAYVEGSRTLPPSYYTDPQIFEMEKEKIFRHFWLGLGHESGLAKGSYRLQQVIGNNLIVLKDHVGVVRVFYNTCRHRNTVLCEEPVGNLNQTIQCPYHQWTYRLNGQLLPPKIMKGVDTFKAEENGLIAVPLHIQVGFIFVNLSKGLVEPFDVQYAPMIPKLTEWNGKNLKLAHSVTAKIRANYKLTVTNF